MEKLTINLVNVYIANWKIAMCSMDNSIIAMAILNSYVAVYQYSRQHHHPSIEFNHSYDWEYKFTGMN